MSLWKLKYPGRPRLPLTQFAPDVCPHEEVNTYLDFVKCWACNSVVIPRETKTQSVFIHERDPA